MAVARKITPADLASAINNRLDNEITHPHDLKPLAELEPVPDVKHNNEPADNKKPLIPEGQKDTPPAGPDEPTKEKKVLITAKVNESTLKMWKQFCLDHDTTLTDTIKRAVNYYIKMVNDGYNAK